VTPHCPPREVLERLLERRLDDATGHTVEEHVEACAACQETLSALAEADAARIWRAKPPADLPPWVDTFLLRFQAVPPAPTLSAPPLAESPSRPDAGRPGPAALPRVEGYEILGELGRGGMGVVYRARHRKLNRPVALKMILSGPHSDRAQRARFVREAEAVARLRHPNIVQIYEAGEQDGQPFLALELVEGGSLAERTAGTPLPAGEAAALLETLARAVHHAHEQGIIHRDLKPANILLTFSPSPEASR
jgi:hypothetical protein